MSMTSAQIPLKKYRDTLIDTLRAKLAQNTSVLLPPPSTKNQSWRTSSTNRDHATTNLSNNTKTASCREIRTTMFSGGRPILHQPWRKPITSIMRLMISRIWQMTIWSRPKRYTLGVKCLIRRKLSLKVINFRPSLMTKIRDSMERASTITFRTKGSSRTTKEAKQPKISKNRKDSRWITLVMKTISMRNR